MTMNKQIDTGFIKNENQLELKAVVSMSGDPKNVNVCQEEEDEESDGMYDHVGSAKTNDGRDLVDDDNKEEGDETIGNILFGIGSEQEINKTIRYIRRAMAKRKRLLDMTRR